LWELDKPSAARIKELQDLLEAGKFANFGRLHLL
jgi:hypothetical protein